jgi:hypothetical protein
MTLERTLIQLMACPLESARARELGQMGYMQWLGGLPGEADYEAEAAAAYMLAVPFRDTDPAIAVFCDLLRDSLRRPLRPLALALPERRRRGGASERRAAF